MQKIYLIFLRVGKKNYELSLEQNNFIKLDAFSPTCVSFFLGPLLLSPIYDNLDQYCIIVLIFN